MQLLACVYWHGFFVLNSALNTGFFFGLESELCVVLEFRLVSTCSRFKITLHSSPLKTWLKSARTFVNLIEPGNPCFNFSLINAMLPQASPEGTFNQNLCSRFAQTIMPNWPAVSKLSFAMYRIFWLQSSITLKNVLNLDKVKSWQNHKNSFFLVWKSGNHTLQGMCCSPSLGKSIQT